MIVALFIAWCAWRLIVAGASSGNVVDWIAGMGLLLVAIYQAAAGAAKATVRSRRRSAEALAGERLQTGDPVELGEDGRVRRAPADTGWRHPHVR